MNNPLVAEREDSTKSFSGIQIAESVDETKKGIENGDWSSAVLGSVTTALGGLSAAMDPLGELIASGVGWLMEHVGPVSDALDELTGDADQVKAHAKTWQNIADEVAKARTDLENLVEKDVADWSGEAADAYRNRNADNVTLLEAAQKAAEGAANGTKSAGEVVAAVRTVVRDLLSDLAGHLVSWGLQVAATLGIGLTWVIPQVVAKVAEVASRIAKVTTKLVRALGKLSPMLRKLGDSFGRATEAFKNIKNAKGAHSAADTTSPNSAKSFDSPAPNTNKAPDSPASTSPQSGPKVDPPAPNANKGDSPGTTSPQSGPKVDPPAPNAKAPDTGGSRGPDGGDGPPVPSKGSGGSTNPSSKSGAGNRPDIRGNNRGPQKEGTPADQKRKCGDPIDVASGDVILEQTDVELAGVLPLLLARTHISSYRVGQHFGPSWASTVDQRLEVDERGVCFAAEDGTLLFYPRPGPGSSVMPSAGPRRSLSRGDMGEYVIRGGPAGQDLHFRSGAGDGTLPLVAITDRNGHRIDFARDSSGTPTEIQHSGGYRVRVDSEDGRVTALHLCGANNGEDLLLVRYEYEDGHLANVVNASGLPLRFTYDQSGRLTSWTDRNGAWYRYHYDHAGRVVRADGSGGFLSGSLEYDDENHITWWTNSLGQRTEFQLNELGQTVREVDAAGNEVLSEWDAYDRLLASTDEIGRRLRYDRDEHGNLTTVTRPDGGQTLFEYDELGLPVTIVAPDGTISRRQYDERGNLVKEVVPNGAVTTFDYDERGGLTTIAEPLGVVQQVSTDAVGLPVAITDDSGAVTRYERDGFGRVTSITDPTGGVTWFGWTVDGKPAWRQQPDGALERWGYDGEGNLRTHADALGQVTQTEVTHFDLPAAEVRPDGTRLSFGYDTELRLISVTNEQGLVWRYDYDEAGNLVRETDFNERTVTRRHDAAGQLLTRTNGAGETTSFTRNVLGDIVERRTSDGTTTFSYDEADQLVEARNEDARVTFQRDELGRVLSETVNGRTLTSAYDALGRRIRRRTPSGVESVWEYDSSHQPTALHTAGRTLRFDHDPAGREIRRRLGSDAVVSHTWDVNDQLARQTVHSAAGQQVARRSYSYRADGMLTGIDDQLAGPRTFDLDRGGRVTSVQGHGWGERYAYDAAGNVVNASWPTAQASPEAESLGQREYSGTLVQRAGRVTYKHDPQGRVVFCQRKRLSRKPETWRYFWDADDQLIGVLTPDGTNWRYRYDPLGRRTAKQRLSPDGTYVVEQVDFTWDGVVLAEQVHSVEGTHGSTLGEPHATVWDYEPGTFRPLTQTERSLPRDASQQWVDEQFHAIITDLVGTPTELVNEHGGVEWFRRSSLWGNSLDDSGGGGVSTPLRFPGQYHDAESGLNYNLYRHYDPTTGRYTSTDPVGLAAGPNPHRYVTNPHTKFDPLGLAPCDVDHNSSIVWRNLRDDERPENGLSAKNPNTNKYSPAGHVMFGSNPNVATQFISSSRSPSVIEQWNGGKRTAEIDLNKVNAPVHDLSTPAGRAASGVKPQGRPNNFADASAEVLIERHVPPEAIRWVYPGAGS